MVIVYQFVRLYPQRHWLTLYPTASQLFFPTKVICKKVQQISLSGNRIAIFIGSGRVKIGGRINNLY
jgi:hypothetical protein